MSPMIHPRQICCPAAGSRPWAVLKIRTETEAVAGAMRQTGRKRRKSRQRRSSGLMLRVTMAPQKMRISRAPERAKRTAVGGDIPLTRAPARLAA